MLSFGRFVVRWRIPIIVATLALTVFLGERMRYLGVNSDLISYLPADSKAVELHKRISETYGGNDLVVVALESRDGNVFTAKGLNTLAQLTSAYEQASYEDDRGPRTVARHVISLTNTMDIRGNGEVVTVGDLIDPDNIPSDSAELAELRRHTLANDMYAGRLVSTDGTFASIILRMHTGSDSSLAAAAVKEATARILSADASPDGEEFTAYYAGVPIWNQGLNQIIFGDLAVLIPLVAFLVVSILLISFRTLRGVLLPLGTVIMSTIWTMGFMQLTGIEMTMVSNTIPVLLIAVGSAYGIHLLNRYREEVDRLGRSLERGPELNELVARTVQHVGIAIFLAGATTLVGFLSFLTAYLTLVKDFGIFCAAGVGFALLISLTFLPAVLSLLKTPEPRTGRWEAKGDRLVQAMHRLGEFTLSHRRIILVLTLLIAAVSVAAVTRLTRNVNMIEYFQYDHPVRQGDRIMKSHFGGATPVQVLVEGDIKDPAVLQQIFRIEKFMTSLPHVRNVQSVATLVAKLNLEMYGNYAIPDSRAKVGALWLNIEGNKILEQMIAPDERGALITGTIGGIDSYVMIGLANQLDRFLSTHVMGQWSVTALPKAASDDSPEFSLLVTRAAELIALDLRGRPNSGDIHEGEIASILKTILRADLSEDDVIRRRGFLAETTLNYFRSGNADVDISDDQDLERLKSGFMSLTKARQTGSGTPDSTPTKEGIIQLLKDVVDPEEWEDEPELLAEVAAHLLDPYLLEAGHRFDLERCMVGLLPHIPPDLRSDEWLQRNLRGDLATLWNREIPVASTDPGSVAPMATFEGSGLPRIYRELDASLLASQVQSLIIALVLVFLMLALQFRSLLAGLVGCIPISFTVLVNFAVMVAVGVPLDTSTVLIASLAVGIGIDYTIHYMNRLRVETRARADLKEAIQETTRTSGTAITINAVSVGVGFLTLLWASLIPMQNFGWMTALTMAVSALSSMVILPVIVMAIGRRRLAWTQTGLPTLPPER